MRLLGVMKAGAIITQRRICSRLVAATNMSTVSGRIGYVTDIEGNYEYWNKYLSVSEVLYKDGSSPRTIKLEDGCQFVYGGDACDRGSGCLRVMKDLVDLKEMYPDRVHLILGNRDINKLRIQSSMHPSVLATLPSVYWLRALPEETTGPSYKLNDSEDKMKWILGKTMGAPIAYECRREELSVMASAPSTCSTSPPLTGGSNTIGSNTSATTSDTTSATSDQPLSALQPWESFLGSTDPVSGLLTRYLELGQIAVVIGDVLFVHGAVHEYSMGWVPPTLAQARAARSADPSNPLAGGYVVEGGVHEWAAQMNAFVAEEIKDYRTRTTEYLQSLAVGVGGAKSDNASASVSVSGGGDSAVDEDSRGIWEKKGGYAHPQPGSRLVQYGMGRLADGTLNPSVIYASYLQQIHGKVPVTKQVPLSAKTADWLKQSGVNKVVVGHQPVGDVPLLMKEHGVQVLSADTSYSKNVQWPLSQLLAFHPNTVSNPTTPDINYQTTPVHTIVDASTEWTTWAEFELLYPLPSRAFYWPLSASANEYKNDALRGASRTYVRLNNDAVNGSIFSEGAKDSSSSSVSAKNSTRSPRAGFEVIFEPYLSASEDGLTTVVKTNMEVMGYLSSGYPFVFTDTADEDEDAYIGKTTSSGWVVRAKGVHPLLDTDFVDTNNIDTYYVLSSVEGYTFRNRLVHESRIQDEF